MSKCVVRMEMPKGCLDCPCANGEYGYCQADKEERQIGDPNERPSWCPIICSLPDWHGRLVDVDKLFRVIPLKVCVPCPFGEEKECADCVIEKVMEMIDNDTTIAPAAERSET